MRHDARDYRGVDAPGEIDPNGNVCPYPQPDCIDQLLPNTKDHFINRARLHLSLNCISLYSLFWGTQQNLYLVSVLNIPVLLVGNPPIDGQLHEVPRQHFSYAPEQGSIAVLPPSIDDGTNILIWLPVKYKKSLGFGSDENPYLLLTLQDGPEKRLDAEPIVGCHYLSAAFVVQVKGKIASRMIQEFGSSMLLVEGDYELRVRAAAELVAGVAERWRMVS
jgi:hypothetical protein